MLLFHFDKIAFCRGTSQLVLCFIPSFQLQKNGTMIKTSCKHKKLSTNVQCTWYLLPPYPHTGSLNHNSPVKSFLLYSYNYIFCTKQVDLCTQFSVSKWRKSLYYLHLHRHNNKRRICTSRHIFDAMTILMCFKIESICDIVSLPCALLIIGIRAIVWYVYNFTLTVLDC